VELDRHVREVLLLHVERGLHLAEREAATHALQDVHRHEDAVGEEARLVDGPRAGCQRRRRRRHAPGEVVVRQVDQDPARHVRAGERADAVALGEEPLRAGVQHQLGRLALVDAPPELLRALQARHEAGLREPRRPVAPTRVRLLHRHRASP
jgi:hypothetical protein